MPPHGYECSILNGVVFNPLVGGLTPHLPLGVSPGRAPSRLLSLTLASVSFGDGRFGTIDPSPHKVAPPLSLARAPSRPLLLSLTLVNGSIRGCLLADLLIRLAERVRSIVTETWLVGRVHLLGARGRKLDLIGQVLSHNENNTKLGERVG